jgi:hypothetical protein
MLTTSEAMGTDSAPALQLFTPRLALSMGAIVVLQSALLMFVIANPKFPFPGASAIEQLPAAICAISLVFALFWAPFLMKGTISFGQMISSAIFASLWLAVVLAFFLMISARLTPVDGMGIFLACAWMFLFAMSAVLLAQCARRAYAGVIFFWVFALPVCAYLLAEIFLISPAGNMGWTQAESSKAYAMRACVHWMLNLSPGTAIAGMLNGVLADNSETSRAIPFGVLTFLNANLIVLLRRKRLRQAVTAQQDN